ncbi:MAG: DUF111 family protein, partial [Actinobacteria bacterium]|nr:DUF111 family protein [Actinomycetota bacterium]
MALRVERDLAERGERVVELERLEELAVEVLGAEDGPRAVRRLRRYRDLQDLDNGLWAAGAEAAVHGTTPERVHFHEVGALDAIIDMLGVMAACEELGFDEFYTRPVTLGRGWAEMAHGTFPVPPPAVLRLLEGVPVRD